MLVVSSPSPPDTPSVFTSRAGISVSTARRLVRACAWKRTARVPPARDRDARLGKREPSRGRAVGNDGPRGGAVRRARAPRTPIPRARVRGDGRRRAAVVGRRRRCPGGRRGARRRPCRGRRFARATTRRRPSPPARRRRRRRGARARAPRGGSPWDWRTTWSVTPGCGLRTPPGTWVTRSSCASKGLNAIEAASEESRVRHRVARARVAKGEGEVGERGRDGEETTVAGEGERGHRGGGASLERGDGREGCPARARRLSGRGNRTRRTPRARPRRSPRSTRWRDRRPTGNETWTRTCPEIEARFQRTSPAVAREGGDEETVSDRLGVNQKGGLGEIRRKRRRRPG